MNTSLCFSSGLTIFQPIHPAFDHNLPQTMSVIRRPITDQITTNWSYAKPVTSQKSTDNSGLVSPIFSRKVFVGGLPPDISECNIRARNESIRI